MTYHESIFQRSDTGREHEKPERGQQQDIFGIENNNEFFEAQTNL